MQAPPMTSGSSTDTASPIASPLSAIPGPDDAVNAIAPPYAHPSATHAAAISSSAWMVRTSKRLSADSSCRISEAGVIG